MRSRRDRPVSDDREDQGDLVPSPGDTCACGAELMTAASLIPGMVCAVTGLWPRYAWRQAGRERFTVATPCPFACDVCRRPLSWDGGCMSCFGTRTPGDKATWRFPGDRYERQETLDDEGRPALGPHWVKVAQGPRPSLSVAENQEAARTMAALIRKMTLPFPRGDVR